ncbi:copper chaperone PCu(A)C [Corynebacterium matruchotii]|uniref:copper chaperone PCu(A)C n=1 Tax=Corynebacterium matruchotii TaxID=43768 RepID=UPI0028E19151|nr:copper chaperone PCu(A)C [Corynebacterium matruchotii]
MNLRRRIGTGICILAVSALALSGCANSERAATKSTRSAKASASASASAAAAAASTSGTSSNSDTPIAFTSAYVRAADEGSDTTAIFGTLKNTTDKDITITGFSSSADADSFELHEVVDGQMRQKEGGFVIPANGTLKLEPGHEHFMLVGLKSPVKAGEKVSVKAELSDGTTIDLGEIPGRQVAAGAEDYSGDSSNSHGQGSGIAGDAKSGDTKNDASGSTKGGIKVPGKDGDAKSGDTKSGDAKSGDSKAGAAAGAAGAGAAGAGQGDAKAGDAAKGGDTKGGSKHGGKHGEQGAGGAGAGAGAGAAGAEQSAGIRG